MSDSCFLNTHSLQKELEIVIRNLVLRVVLVVRSDQFVTRRIGRQLIAVPRVQVRRDLIGVLVGLWNGGNWS